MIYDIYIRVNAHKTIWNDRANSIELDSQLQDKSIKVQSNLSIDVRPKASNFKTAWKNEFTNPCQLLSKKIPVNYKGISKYDVLSKIVIQKIIKV